MIRFSFDCDFHVIAFAAFAWLDLPVFVSISIDNNGFPCDFATTYSPNLPENNPLCLKNDDFFARFDDTDDDFFALMQQPLSLFLCVCGVRLQE